MSPSLSYQIMHKTYPVSVATCTAFQVVYRLAGKDHTKLQKVPDLFNEYAEINGNTGSPQQEQIGSIWLPSCPWVP